MKLKGHLDLIIIYYGIILRNQKANSSSNLKKTDKLLSEITDKFEIISVKDHSRQAIHENEKNVLLLNKYFILI